MNHSAPIMMEKEEFLQILRSVIIADSLQRHNEISPLQRRLFADAERFGVGWEAGEQEAFADAVLHEADAHVGELAMDELAWWIADREYQRMAPHSRSRDAKDLITHRIYHDVLDEFERHGIEHLEISDLNITAVSPEIVRVALAQFKKEAIRRRSG